MRITANPEKLQEMAEEQVRLFASNQLTRGLAGAIALHGAVVLECERSPRRYLEPAAQVADDPKADALTVSINTPTIDSYVSDLLVKDGLNEEDFAKLHIGLGIANFVITESWGRGLTRKKIRFAEALMEPRGFYANVMDSPIFDDSSADVTARLIATEGYVDMARVNSRRLTAGMYIEVQPDSAAVRDRVKTTFATELGQMFDGKSDYVTDAQELFKSDRNQAERNFADNTEVMMGMSFPMSKKEIQDTLKILKP